MRIIGQYYFAGAREEENKFEQQITEIKKVISSFCAAEIRGLDLNKQFKKCFEELGWSKKRLSVDYSLEHYVDKPDRIPKTSTREMGLLKNRVGLEVQFGQSYPFMTYSVCVKMPIFKNHNIIDFGVGIVGIDIHALSAFSFEQIVWELENKGQSNTDIPIIIFGVGYEEQQLRQENNIVSRSGMIAKMQLNKEDSDDEEFESNMNDE